MAAIQDEDEIGRLNLTPDPRILEVLGKIPYQPWQCLAELVDNSFDELLSAGNRDPSDPVAVRIDVPKPSSGEDAHVSVSDEGRGMSREKLEKSLRAGFTGKAGFETLGLFGMGFNIATARLGNRTEVRTTQSGDQHWLVAEIDLLEMQKRGSFHIPVRRAPKSDFKDHGTQVVVHDLNPEMLDTLRRPATIGAIRRRLGRIYSYLLRSATPVPGLPDSDLGGRGITLYLNGKRIEPWIPCVWSESRIVKYKGSEISAVQAIEHELTDAYACRQCGNWQRHFNSGRCLFCDRDDLERRQRKVWGWLGVQRYLHESQYGIDFIRNGRTIVTDDKGLFTWLDPDTGETSEEYPVNIPATQGRLVGEIHLDHVSVDYQKTDFKRETPEWLEAAIYLRGEGPMREQKARSRGFPENRSPLARLFKPFQENRPGLKYLIPGDGNRAIFVKAQEWGEYFHRGLPEYQSDEKWYEAAARHDEIRDSGPEGGKDKGGGDNDLRKRTGLGPLPPDPPAPPDPAGGSKVKNPIPAPEGETEDERFERYGKDATEFYDLAGEIVVAGLGKRQVRVFETSAELVSADGAKVPVVSRARSGMDLEVYVSGEHTVFREFGRDPRDYAIVEIAQALRAIGNSKVPLLTVAAEVTSQFPDQRTTTSALRDRAEGVLGRIRELMGPIVAGRAAEMWSALPSDCKVAAEREAARTSPGLDWREATRDGSFAAFLDGPAIALLVSQNPGTFLDRTVFTSAWAGWSDEQARDRQVSQVMRLLDTVGEFLTDNGAKNRVELSMIRLTVDMLDQLVARPE